MKYAKPELAVLGAAVRVIESHTAKNVPANEDGILQMKFNPAYDLDE